MCNEGKMLRYAWYKAARTIEGTAFSKMTPAQRAAALAEANNDEGAQTARRAYFDHVRNCEECRCPPPEQRSQ